MSKMESKLKAFAGDGGTVVNLATILRAPADRSGDSSPIVGPGLEQRAANG